MGSHILRYIVTLVLLSIPLWAADLDVFNEKGLSLIEEQVAFMFPLYLGMTLIFCRREIDLSIGAVAALAGVVYAGALNQGLDHAPAVLRALGVAAVFGAGSGLAVGFFRVPSFVATLGAALLARQLATQCSGAAEVKIVREGLLWPKALFDLWIAVACFMVLFLLFWILGWTAGGRGEERFRKGGGLGGALLGLIAYLLSACLAAGTGILQAAHTKAASFSSFTGVEVEAIFVALAAGSILLVHRLSVPIVILLAAAASFWVKALPTSAHFTGLSQDSQKVVPVAVLLGVALIVFALDAALCAACRRPKVEESEEPEEPRPEAFG